MTRTAHGITALVALLLAAGCTSGGTAEPILTPAARSSAPSAAAETTRTPAAPPLALSPLPPVPPLPPAPSLTLPPPPPPPAAKPPKPPTPPRPAPLRRPVITVDGLGPYRVGTTAADLVRAGRLVRVGPGVDSACEVWYRATPPYAPALGVVQIHDGVLRSLSVNTRKYATSSGARVGMTLDDLRRIYGAGRLVRLDNPYEGPDGWSVRAGDRAVVFVFDPNNWDKIRDIVAGLRVAAEGAVTDGEYYAC